MREDPAAGGPTSGRPTWGGPTWGGPSCRRTHLGRTQLREDPPVGRTSCGRIHLREDPPREDPPQEDPLATADLAVLVPGKPFPFSWESPGEQRLSTSQAKHHRIIRILLRFLKRFYYLFTYLFTYLHLFYAGSTMVNVEPYARLELKTRRSSPELRSRVPGSAVGAAQAPRGHAPLLL